MWPRFFEQQYRALKSEGVKFTADNRVIMEKYQWHPESESAPMDIRDWPLVF